MSTAHGLRVETGIRSDSVARGDPLSGHTATIHPRSFNIVGFQKSLLTCVHEHRLYILLLSSAFPKMADERPIVVDNGTGFVKTGYAGSNFPEFVFPSIVGRPILRVEERDAAAGEIKDIMVGTEAAEMRNYLQVTQPMEHGIVKDFADMRHGKYVRR